MLWHARVFQKMCTHAHILHAGAFVRLRIPVLTRAPLLTDCERRSIIRGISSSWCAFSHGRPDIALRETRCDAQRGAATACRNALAGGRHHEDFERAAAAYEYFGAQDAAEIRNFERNTAHHHAPSVDVPAMTRRNGRMSEVWAGARARDTQRQDKFASPPARTNSPTARSTANVPSGK